MKQFKLLLAAGAMMIASGMQAQTDVTSTYLTNAGFDVENDWQTSNVAATGGKNTIDISNWTSNGGAAWSSSAAFGYGSTGQLNGVAVPATDKDGNANGGCLGISVGWSGIVTYYQEVTLPAGVYSLSYNGYNNLSGVTQFKSLFGFYSTSGSALAASTKTSFAYGAWERDDISYTLEEETTLRIQVGGQAISGGSGSNAKVFFDNLTLTYQSLLDGVKAMWQEAHDKGVSSLDSEEYAAVTGEERTNLQTEVDKAEPTTKEGYEDATSALDQALVRFTAAKWSYVNYAVALQTVDPELAYASEDAKTAFTNALNAGEATSASDANNKINAITKALRAYYESHALAEGVEGAVNMTDRIANPDANDGNNGWTWTGNKNNPRNTESWTDSQGGNEHMYFDGGNWGANSWTTTMKQTVSLPAGKYLLTSKSRGSVNLTTYTMAVGETSVNLPIVGSSGNVFDRGWGDVSVEFETDGSDVEIVVTAETSTQHEWFSISNFRLVRLELYTEMADEDDYNALQDAIDFAEEKVLGFDAYEYAPYKNVEALQALEAAKAIDPTTENGKDEVNALANALNMAEWKSNTEELDAIFDGQFASTEALTESGKIVLPGWTKVDGIRLLVKDTSVDPGLDYTDGKAAVFSWGGTTLTYGAQTGYTLPLNQNELYELKFKISGWRDGDFPSVVKVALDGKEQSAPNASLASVNKINSTEGNPFVELKFYVVPTAEGNSTLTIYANHHFTVADLSLKHAGTNVIDETAIYDNTLADENVSILLNRTIKEGMNTVVLPFDLTADDITTLGGEGAVAYTVSAYNAATDNLTFGVLSEVPANQPFFLKATQAGKEYSFENKTLVAGDPILEVSEDCSLVGNYDFKKTVPQGDANGSYYILSGGKFYSVDSEVTIKNTRFYVATSAPAGANALSFSFEDEVTGINGIVDETAAPKAIYNLQGQKVNAPVKGGIYIIDGKKMLVK